MRKGRLISILLLLVMGMTGLVQLGSTGWMVSYGASLTKEEVLAVAETIDDEAAKAEILAAVNDGAEVQFRYAEDGRVASYRIIREGEAKAHQDMTEGEKKQALQLLIDRGTVPNRISVNGTYYSLNITLWMERGIIVYGETKQVNEANSVTSGSNYKDGQYRFWGYDINGGLYGNDDFPRDSDSGTPAYEKDWLTTGEIRESSIARKYIGEHGLSANSRYSDQDKKKTAELWLKENPAWKSSGITAQYILDHFYFNSVISDSGLTMGQFTGVHKSRQSGTLYYQSFAVQGKIVLFEISEGTVEERILIEDPELPAEPIEPEEGEDPSMEMEVSLSVPSQTYVGHPTTVTDSTGFTVDGAQRSATRVYAEGLAKNSFRLPQGGGSIRKNSTVPTKAQAVFDTAGTYPVILTVTAKNGTSGSDQRSVQVVNTPSILHSLTGTQKQNRAQCINVWVATDPKRPLTELWIEIRDQLSGETVHLSHNLSAALENEKDNSDGIKTRPIEALESDELFTNCRLEFLTKFAEERQLTYTIYVRDSGGKTDQIVQEFTVTPDLAPEPSIGMEVTFLRSRGQKTAEIEAVDQSRTDGDQLDRRWEFAALNDEGAMTDDFSEALSMAGYEDRSFGTGQKIALLKHGVGKFRMKLTVTDVWTEATLPEYVTEADRRSASVTKDGEVINVAPQVSLEPKELTKAEILLLSADEETDRLVRSQLSQLEAALLEHGCDVSITAERMLPQTVSEDRPWTKTVEVNTPFGYQGSWTPLYEKDNFIVDDQNFYKIDATWLGSGLDEYPQPPYTITAWNGETGAVEWTYTFDESVLTVPDRGPYFAQDDSGTYLYFVSESRTLVLDKTTGAKLAVLPFAVGNRCFVAANRILTVKNDGIYRIDISTGRVTKIHSGLIGEGSARFGGRLQFVTRGGKTLYRASMDMETQKVSLQELKVAASADASYDAEAFCTDGSLLVKETCGDTIRFFLFDEDGDLRGSVSQTGAELMGTAVKDGSGNVTYVAYISSEKESGVYYTNFICCELTTGKTATVSLNNKNGYPAEPRIIAAEQVDSSAYVVAGGYLTWIADYGWGNGPAHGYPQRTKTIRFDMTAATGQLRSNGELELNDMQEYGSSSAVYGVIQSGQNGQYQSPPSGNITTLYRRYQTAEQVEQRCRSRYLTRNGSADRQEAFVLTKESLAEESLAQRIQRWLDDGTAKTSTYVNLRKTAEGGALRRTMELEPDTTYYYEYDLLMPEGAEEDAEDIFSVGAAINQRSNQLTDIQYSVVKTMAESFDNNRVGNDYFSHIDPEDLVSDRLQASPIPESRKLRSDATTLSFTVEEGCQAVLSFDYMIRRYSGSAYFGNEIRIDGERWQVPLQAGVTLEGRYTHPLLLEAGNHTVELFAATYSTTESVTAIDDVTVEYVELSEENQSPGRKELVDGTASQKERIGEGWTRISGSFHTPTEVLAYQGLKGTIATETAGQGSISTLQTSTHRSKQLTYLFPAGEIPVYASAETESKPVRSSGRHYGVSWTISGTVVTSYLDSYFGTNDENRLGSRGLPKVFTFIFPTDGVAAPDWGDPALKMTFSGTSSTGGGGSVNQVILASVKNPDESTKRKEFFLRTSGPQSGIYGANLRFGGSTQLSFEPGEASERGIANLRIYTVKDGVRLYIAENDITEAQELNRWTADRVTAEIKRDGAPVEEERSMVYAKGQLVYTDVHYYDYEDDPSKASYWKYTHLPFNDGPHPQATVVVDDNGTVTGGTGQILTKPIQRFYVDGKYLVEHWQTDSTGNSTYDKDSNVASMILYIGGGGNAPWIESIAVRPSAPKEGDDVTLAVKVNDREKETLQLDVEIYRDGTLLKKQRFSNVSPNDNGAYPTLVTESILSAPPGKYEAVCTVRDGSGTGIGNRRFTIQPAGSVEGQVAHTAAWDSNRRAYNQNLFGTKATLYNTPMTLAQYKSFEPPRPRGSNVFWAGEELILTAHVGGSPASVTAQIGGYQVRMSNSGQKTADGKAIYKGTLWDRAMRLQWGKEPEGLDVIFRAYYADSALKEHVVPVILDSNTEYWLLHRYQ